MKKIIMGVYLGVFVLLWLGVKFTGKGGIEQNFSILELDHFTLGLIVMLILNSVIMIYILGKEEYLKFARALNLLTIAGWMSLFFSVR